MGENILEVKNLHYIYQDGTCALKGVNMAVERGKTTAVIGGNGAGKSTLFLNLNGILKPTSGKVYFDRKEADYSPKGLKVLRSGVGMVFQDPDSQLFSASVYQDVSFGAVNLKLPEEVIRQRVDRALEWTGIMHLKNKPTHCLSYGQKKRVALAGVLVMEPRVLVLDEPTAGLDPMGVAEIMKILRQVQEQLGISVVISTHDIDIVPLYCDYVYVMDIGEVISKGTPKEVFSHGEELRKVHLRLPRIAHLMEILQKNDAFVFEDTASTISEARKVLRKWREEQGD